jgi:hypothetical protein
LLRRGRREEGINRGHVRHGRWGGIVRWWKIWTGLMGKGESRWIWTGWMHAEKDEDL